MAVFNWATFNDTTNATTGANWVWTGPTAIAYSPVTLYSTNGIVHPGAGNWISEPKNYASVSLNGLSKDNFSFSFIWKPTIAAIVDTWIFSFGGDFPNGCKCYVSGTSLRFLCGTAAALIDIANFTGSYWTSANVEIKFGVSYSSSTGWKVYLNNVLVGSTAVAEFTGTFGATDYWMLNTSGDYNTGPGTVWVEVPRNVIFDNPVIWDETRTDFSYMDYENPTATAPTFSSTSPLPTVTRGAAYTYQFSAAGTSPINYTIGSLVSGLSATTAGLISGTTYVTDATYSVGVTISNAYGYTTGTFLYTVDSNPVIYTPSAMGTGIAGAYFAYQLNASGGNTPYVWTRTGGTNPTGLAIDSDIGLYSGTIGAGVSAGTYAPEFQVEDAETNTGTQTGSVIVTRTTVVGTIPSTVIKDATLTTVAFTASGGTSPYVFSAANLVSGWAFTSAGVLTGTNSAAGGTYTVAITATDDNGVQDTNNYTVVVQALELAPYTGIRNYLVADTSLASLMGGTVLVYRMPVKQNTQAPYIAYKAVTPRMSNTENIYHTANFQYLIVSNTPSLCDRIAARLAQLLDLRQDVQARSLISDDNFVVYRTHIVNSAEPYQLNERQYATDLTVSVLYMAK